MKWKLKHKRWYVADIVSLLKLYHFVILAPCHNNVAHYRSIISLRVVDLTYPYTLHTMDVRPLHHGSDVTDPFLIFQRWQTSGRKSFSPTSNYGSKTRGTNWMLYVFCSSMPGSQQASTTSWLQIGYTLSSCSFGVWKSPSSWGCRKRLVLTWSWFFKW